MHFYNMLKLLPLRHFIHVDDLWMMYCLSCTKMFYATDTDVLQHIEYRGLIYIHYTIPFF